MTTQILLGLLAVILMTIGSYILSFTLRGHKDGLPGIGGTLIGIGVMIIFLLIR